MQPVPEETPVSPPKGLISRHTRISRDLPFHLSLGVSLGYLSDLANTLDESITTAEVGLIVKEKTSSTRISMAESLINFRTKEPLAGRATVFVSHAQSCSFAKLVRALENQLGFDHMIWLDIMCIRQNSVHRDVRWIGAIIRQIGAFVMVLDPWKAPVCLSRVWCLYELSMCGDDVVLALALAPSERALLVRALEEDPESVRDSLTAFDARTAQVMLESDKAMIMTAIERGFSSPGSAAVDNFNAAVRSVLRKALRPESMRLTAAHRFSVASTEYSKKSSKRSTLDFLSP